MHFFFSAIWMTTFPSSIFPVPLFPVDLCCHSIIYQSPIYAWICSRALSWSHCSASLSSANTTLFWLPWLYNKSWYLLCTFPCLLILSVFLLHFHFRITLSSSIRISVGIVIKIMLNYWSIVEDFIFLLLSSYS